MYVREVYNSMKMRHFFELLFKYASRKFKLVDERSAYSVGRGIFAHSARPSVRPTGFIAKVTITVCRKTTN